VPSIEDSTDGTHEGDDMSAIPVPHLNFHGDARDALGFYAAAFAGQVSIRTYAEVGMPADAPGADGVVYGHVVGPDGFMVMAYDVPGAAAPRRPGVTTRENGATITDQPFFLALGAADLAEAQRRWDALAAGATVIEPLAASPWSAGFGMLTDRFGVTWVISVTEASPIS
jgi:PhnB protein